ncbi:MAG: hypothetical protein GXX96_11910 [Planctomycetaceae bacterium]|nr:hypothetical protein [Planctomycetaceae bacterium]
MSTTIIDRRCTADPVDDPQADVDRHARRRAVREASARRDLHLQAALLAEADVKASEARCDQLADDHQRLCSPWQAELGELEAKAIARIGRREPPDAEEDERRGELAKLIATATSELEAAIALEREVQGVARRKARKIREGHPPGVLILAALGKLPLANPRLLAELHVAQQRVKWLSARKSSAEKSAKIHRYNADEIQAKRAHGDLAASLRHVANWTAEIEAVGSELAAALTEAERVHRAMIDE